MEKEINNDLDQSIRQIILNNIANFTKHYKTSLDHILICAKQYYSDITTYPDIAPKMYQERFRFLPSTWDVFRKIGSGDLVPSALLIHQKKVASMVSKLPYKTQQILLGDVNIPAVPQNLWDGQREKSKLVSDMTFGEARILIDVDKGKIRSINEQKECVPVEIVQDVEMPVGSPYVVVGRTLVVKKRCEIGVNELAKIIEQFGLKITKN